MHFVNFKLQICFPVHNCPFSNLLAADGKSTGDNRISGARGGATLTERSDETFSVMQLFLLTENEAPQDARYSRQESIEVRSLVPKGFLPV